MKDLFDIKKELFEHYIDFSKLEIYCGTLCISINKNYDLHQGWYYHFEDFDDVKNMFDNLFDDFNFDKSINNKVNYSSQTYSPIFNIYPRNNYAKKLLNKFVKDMKKYAKKNKIKYHIEIVKRPKEKISYFARKKEINEYINHCLEMNKDEIAKNKEEMRRYNEEMKKEQQRRK